jgi:hypothetical protein
VVRTAPAPASVYVAPEPDPEPDPEPESAGSPTADCAGLDELVAVLDDNELRTAVATVGC